MVVKLLMYVWRVRGPSMYGIKSFDVDGNEVALLVAPDHAGIVETDDRLGPWQTLYDSADVTSYFIYSDVEYAVDEAPQWMQDLNPFVTEDEGGDTHITTITNVTQRITVVERDFLEQHANPQENDLVFIPNAYSSNITATITVGEIPDSNERGFRRSLAGIINISPGSNQQPVGSINPDLSPFSPQMFSIIQSTNFHNLVVVVHSEVNAPQNVNNPVTLALRNSLRRLHVNDNTYDLTPSGGTLGSIPDVNLDDVVYVGDARNETLEENIWQVNDNVQVLLELSDGNFFLFNDEEGEDIEAGLYIYNNDEWVHIGDAKEPGQAANTFLGDTYTLNDAPQTATLRYYFTANRFGESYAAGTSLPVEEQAETIIDFGELDNPSISEDDFSKETGNWYLARVPLRFIISLQVSGIGSNIGDFVTTGGSDSTDLAERVDAVLRLVTERNGVRDLAAANSVQTRDATRVGNGLRAEFSMVDVVVDLAAGDRFMATLHSETTSTADSIKSTSFTIEQATMRIASFETHQDAEQFLDGRIASGLSDVLTLPRLGQGTIAFDLDNLIDLNQRPVLHCNLRAANETNNGTVPIMPFNLLWHGVTTQPEDTANPPDTGIVYLIATAGPTVGACFMGNVWGAWIAGNNVDFGWRLVLFHNEDGLLRSIEATAIGVTTTSSAISFTANLGFGRA